MEPQIFICGNLETGEKTFAELKASMEPQIFICGNWYTYFPEGWVEIASMEPQIFICGNQSKDRLPNFGITLQWSRRFSSAEIKPMGSRLKGIV